jgi:ABC-type uncharacterized transport system involved in gliding motility auxiliary subunit
MSTSSVGKILGALGLLLLLSSPVTLFLTSGSVTLTAIKAVAGLGLLGAYLSTNFKQLGQFATRRSSSFFATTALLGVVTLGGLVGLNYLAFKNNKRWDLTREKIFTLSPLTSTTLASLKQKVRAIGFLAPGHPYSDSVEQLFQRYQAEAPEKFEYTFKDPQRSPELAAKYQLQEDQATLVLVRGEGPNAPHTTLHTISEEALTNALIKLNLVGAQKVYFLSGHGEWPLEAEGATPGQPGPSLSELRKHLFQGGYGPEELNLAGQKELPRDAALVVIAGAKTPYTQPEVEALRQYLAAGGRLLYFAEARVEPRLEALLAEYGVEVDPGIAADPQYNSGNPYVLVSRFYSEHVLTQPLRLHKLNTEFRTARSLTVLRQGMAPGVKAEPVVLSSPFGWVESTPDTDATPSDGEKSGQLTLVAAATRDTKSARDKRFDEARVVVVGDSDLLLDTHFGHEANRNLVLNAVGWAAQQVEWRPIPLPARESSTLEMDEAMLDNIRFVSTDLLPLSLMGLGMAIWLSRRNK